MIREAVSMIKIEHLSKNFGDLEVLKDINLEVKEGEVVCIPLRRRDLL